MNFKKPKKEVNKRKVRIVQKPCIDANLLSYISFQFKLDSNFTISFHKFDKIALKFNVGL